MKLLSKPYVFILLIILGVTSCSSVPGRKETRTLDRRNKVSVYQEDGITQFNSGRFSQALDYFELAYELNASIDYEESAFLAHTMSLILRKRSQYGKALNYLSSSLSYNQKNNAYRALAEDYYIMSSINSFQEKYTEAFGYAEKALDCDKMIEYSPGIAADLEALSLIAKKMGKEDDSEMYLERSNAVLEAIGNINKIKTELDENQDL